MKGLAPVLTVERALSLLGRSCPPGELALLREEVSAPEDLEAALRAQGLVVRLVRVTLTELATMRLPCLAQLQGGDWLVIHRRRRGDFVIEGAEGRRPIPAGRVSAELSGLALELTPGLPLPGNLWRSVASAVGSDRRTIAAILSTAFLVQFFNLLPPQLTRLALDHALPRGATSLLNAITLGLVFGGLFQAWTSWLRQRAGLFLRVQSQIIAERGFLDHVLRLPFPLLSGRTVGDFMQAMFGLAEARSLLTDRAVGLALDGMTSVLYLAVMVASLPALTGAVALAAGLTAVVAVGSGWHQARRQRAEVEALSKQRASLIESLVGMATVKAMGAEKPVFRRWAELLRVQLVSSLAKQRFGLRTEAVIDGIRQAVTLVVLVGAAYLALRGQATLGSFVAFVQMSGGFMASVTGLANAVVAAMMVWPQFAKASELARLAPARPRLAPPSAGPIVAEDLWFRYAPEAPWVLSGFHLRVEEGEKRGIRGPSGRGKTTVLRLLAGLCVPERGRVRIGGRDPAEARRLLLYLPQFVHLYGGTIYENLRILSAHAPRHRLLEAAEASGLAHFVKTLPSGYETWLPPGAGSLSGGQRQLVALTAAMGTLRRVLILDEAFVNLDGLSRHWLVNSPWFRGRTIVYVSHDTQFASSSDSGFTAEAQPDRLEPRPGAPRLP